MHDGATILLLGGLLLYFAPSLIAQNRAHRNLLAVFLLNLFLGWTFVGWVVALVWAVTKPPPPS